MTVRTVLQNLGFRKMLMGIPVALLLFLGSIGLLTRTAEAGQRTVFNPFTSKLDYISPTNTSGWPDNASGCLNNDGSGNMSYVSCSGGSTVLQSSGVAFGSATNTVTQDTNTFTWNNTNKTLSVTSGAVQVSTALPTGLNTSGLLSLYNTNVGLGDWYALINFVNGSVGQNGWQFGLKGGNSPTGFVFENNGSILARVTNSLSTSQLVKTDANQSLTSATASDVVAAFSGCSGTLYLGADGACHQALPADVVLNDSSPRSTWTSSATFKASVGVTDASGNTIVTIDTTTAALSDFELSVSSQNGNILFGIQNNGHLVSSGTIPSVSSCGTSPTMDANSTDFSGIINVGTGATTSCTLTFASAFANAPVCIVSDDSTAVTADISSRSTSAVVFSFSASIGAGHIFYICVGAKG